MHFRVLKQVCQLAHWLLKLQDTVCICKRRGGSDSRGLMHNQWLQSVDQEPDVISMSFIPITSLLNGISGSGFLSHAINLYLRCKLEHIICYFLASILCVI